MKTELAVILAFCLVSSALGCGGYDFEIPNPQPLSYYNKTLHLNIHLIPHTHDDMGWLKTVDQYYFGIWSNITNAGVQYILDSVHGSIAADTDRRFVLVEVGFFARWWKDLKEGARSVFRRTLAEGRIEFANGGWTMNDEACVYYEDSIDQMTLGHQFLLNTFGITPKVGWHIDPFGHANAQAAMFAQMGFHTFFISRIDYQDKNNRMNNSALEFIWIPETSQGDENAIFTHTTYYHYGDPRNFCWDQRCNFETIVDDPNLPGAYNVERWSDGYIAWFRQESNVYRSTEILHTIGNDFAYQASTYNFKNLERLFNFINNHPEKYNVHIGYSLPSTYINTINKLNITYPYKYDDMFPYADMKDAYWTGYFTSRPAIKGLIRRTGKFLQAMKKMLTQAVWLDSSPYVRANWTAVNTALNALEEAQATAQHHDAITGTQKQFVVYDYQNQIFSGITKLKNVRNF